MSNQNTDNKFQDYVFSVSLPEVRFRSGILTGTFEIRRNRQYQNAGNHTLPIIAVDYFATEDRFKNSYRIELSDTYLGYSDHVEKISVKKKVPKNKMLLRGAHFYIGILDGDHFSYSIHYQIDDIGVMKLVGINKSRMTEDQEKRFQEITKTAASSLEQQEEEYAYSVSEGSTYSSDTYDDTTESAYTTSALEEYKDAIRREMYFLRNNGGRKYKVTNGKCIGLVSDSLAYSFEMETELHISDDAPVSLQVGSDTASGNVLICEGFQIIVVVNRDFGKQIGQALISVEPWKLLEALSNKLSSLSRLNRIAIKLLEEGPKLATTLPPAKIIKGQEAARKKAVTSDITVVWGPPGTGKTYTMAQIAIETLHHGQTVLIVSHSNISVDGVISEISDQLRSHGEERYLRNGEVLRYGYVRDTKLAEDREAVAFNYAEEKNPDLKSRMNQLLIEKDSLRGTSLEVSRKRLDVEEKLKKLRIEIRSEEKKYADWASIIATTISKVTVDPLFKDKRFDYVMFDEVSMAYVPQIICAASYAKNHFIAVGDFRQLAPIAQSQSKKLLSTDLFSYLGICTETGRIHYHPWLVMLNEQRRMYPAIAEFPNKEIYSGLLRDHKDVAAMRRQIVDSAPLSGYAMNLIDLTGTYCAAAKDSNNSRYNILSAFISFAVAVAAQQNGEDSIGIITPYAAQTRLVRAMLLDYQKNAGTKISCATVHQFQGSERDIIIFDAVESYPSAQLGWLMSKNENNNVTRLINVAVTRARGKFIACANTKFWEKKADEITNIFYRLLEHLKARGNVISHKEHKLDRFLSDLHVGKHNLITQDLAGATRQYIQDLQNAKEKIVVSLPDGNLAEDLESTIYRALIQRKKNGVRVLCKTNDFAALPSNWKNITQETENAYFPLTVIDDKVAWYGMPPADWAFHDGYTKFVTVCPVYLRTTGVNTIEILQSLTDLEYISRSNQKAILTEKNDDSQTNRKIQAHGNNTSSENLAAFIHETKKCPRCGRPMEMLCGRTGKFYLKCRACEDIEYLTPDDVNHYIDRKRVTCPIHHCEIYARLGKYGVYIRCEQGHYLKPSDI